MNKNPSLILGVVYLVGDLLAIIGGFALAYFWRVHVDARPFFFDSDGRGFLATVALLLPIWVIVLFVFKMYDRNVYEHRPRLFLRIGAVAVASVMALIAVSFFTQDEILPARMIAVYSLLFTVVFLVIEREILSLFARVLMSRGVWAVDIVVFGEGRKNDEIVEYLKSNSEPGVRVREVVSDIAALEKVVAGGLVEEILQTNSKHLDHVYELASKNHLRYMYVPEYEKIVARNGRMTMMGPWPIVNASVTPLSGWGRVVKRIMDFTLGGILLVLALPIIGVLALYMKILEPRGKVFYKATRLSRYGEPVSIYKLRSMKSEYSGMTPEEAFSAMGKPELSKKYRKNGDYLEDDPRIGRFGRFLRATSLDELPQFFNVVRGDISLVGPRALEQSELDQYANKHLILSVKSGLTGLAQVEGRREISFTERRELDVYYIQHWSVAMDLQIIGKTIRSVLLRRGAK